MRHLASAAMTLFALLGCNSPDNKIVYRFLEKDYLACKSSDYVKLLASNYGSNPEGFQQLTKIGIASGHCRVFSKGDGVLVSENDFSGRIENIGDMVTRRYYSAFDPKD